MAFLLISQLRLLLHEIIFRIHHISRLYDRDGRLAPQKTAPFLPEIQLKAHNEARMRHLLAIACRIVTIYLYTLICISNDSQFAM